MAAVQEDGGSRDRGRAAIVRLVDQEQEQERRRLLYDRLPRLYGSGVRYDTLGNIYIRTHMGVAREGFDTTRYVQIYPTVPQANILSDRSSYGKIRRSVISMPEDVETAIRMVGHMVENIEIKERPQAEAVAQRVEELIDLMGRRKGNLGEEELSAMGEETSVLLARMHLNPATLKDENKKSMVQRTIRSSGIKDRLGRRNPQAIQMLLSGALNDTRKRLESLKHMGLEFTRDLKALNYERETSRRTLKNIAQRVRPDVSIPNLKSVNQMILDLDRLVHLNGYRSTAIEIVGKLGMIKQLLAEGKETDVVRSGLLQQVWLLITGELQRGEEVLEEGE